MEPEKFSMNYKVRKLTGEDVGIVCKLCEGNEIFYRYCPPKVSEEGIRCDMECLPSGKKMEDKYYVGYFDEGKLIGVMDLIDGYPDEGTAFVGFFMTDVSVQGRGIGSGIIAELCAYLKNEGYARVRLAWVEGNRQSQEFWRKNQFVETGEVKEKEQYTVIVAERKLENQ